MTAVVEAHYKSKEALPDQDFGIPLGAAQGVIASSNLDDYFFSGEHKIIQVEGGHMRCGYKNQCVSFSRAYMICRYGCQFENVGPAGNLFNSDAKYDYVNDLQTGEKHKWVGCENGKTKRRPEVGDTLIYKITKKAPVGHVATITFVAEDSSYVGIGEENVESKDWCGKPYGRLEPLKKDAEGCWTIVETDPAFEPSHGWKFIETKEGKPLEPRPYAEGVTEEETRTVNDKTLHYKTYPPLKVRKEFLSPDSKPSELMRFDSPNLAPAVSKTLKEEQEDERDTQIRELPAEDAELKQKLECIQKIRSGQKKKRAQLYSMYEKLLSSRFEEISKKKQERKENLAAEGKQVNEKLHAHQPSVHREGHHSAPFSHKDYGQIRLPYSRSGIPRTTHWESVYAPNEELGIASIGKGMRAFKIIEQSMCMFADRFVIQPTEIKQSMARQFDIPLPALEAAIAQVRHQCTLPSSSSKLDSLMGTMSLVFDDDADHYKILHTELDSLAYLIEINAMNEQYVKSHAKLSVSFVMSGFGNDLHRAVRQFQVARLGKKPEEANETLYFVDFGPVDKLECILGIELPKDVRYAYEVERIQNLFCYESLKEFLADKKHDTAIGDLQSDDIAGNPLWDVQIVQFFADGCEEYGGNKVDVNLEDAHLYFDNKLKMNLVWKMAPWSQLFVLYFLAAQAAETGDEKKKKNSQKLHDFIFTVGCADPSKGLVPSVMQPLFAHIVSHPQFLPLLTDFALAIDKTPRGTNATVDQLKNTLDNETASSYVIPETAWEEYNQLPTEKRTGLPPCSYNVNNFSGRLNIDHAGGDEAYVTPEVSEQDQKERVQHEHVVTHKPSSHHPALHSLYIGSKRSASMMLEARLHVAAPSKVAATAITTSPTTAASAGSRPHHFYDRDHHSLTSIYDCLHPAAHCFLPMIMHGNAAHIKKNDEKEEEKGEKKE